MKELLEIKKSLPTFGFAYTETETDCQLDATDLPYYLTIYYDKIGESYSIITTHKKTLVQQVKVNTDLDFIHRSLKNLYYLGF